MDFSKLTNGSNNICNYILSISCSPFKTTDADMPRASSTFVTVFIVSPFPLSILEI